MGDYAGELIAVLTLFCWAIGSQCFEAAGKRVGSMAVNMLRLIQAFFIFCIALWLRTGQPIPLDFSTEAWAWLLLSGVVGFTLGDMCLFRAFVELGPRLSLLLMSLHAPMSAILGWLWLGEQYGPVQWLGMAVTLFGVGWVIVERPPEEEPLPDAAAPGASPQNGEGRWSISRNGRNVRRITVGGVLLGIGGAVGQALGSVTSKYGMGDGDAMAATQIRVIGGLVGLIALFFVIRWWKPTFRALRDVRAMTWLTAGAFFGPFLGVWLYLRAMQLTTVGVVATIVALLPVVIIPFSIVFHREHISRRALAGAVIAFIGVALLISR